MGVINGAFPMTTTADVVYTHKKFKRAAAETCDGGDRDHPIRDRVLLATGTEAPWLPHPHTNLGLGQGSPLVGAAVINGLRFVEGNGDDTCHDDGFRCEYCEQKFVKICALEKHVNSVHPQHHRQFVCDVCTVSFKTKNSLFKHLKSKEHNIHSGISHNNKIVEGSLDKRNEILRNKEFHPSFDPPSDFTSGKDAFSNSPFSQDDTEEAVFASQHQNLVKDNDNNNQLLDMPSISSKAIYKPKFRAQYSIEEVDEPDGNTPGMNLASNNQSLDLSSVCSISSSNHFKTYQTNTLLYNTLDPDSPKSRKPPKANLPPLDIKSIKKEVPNTWNSSGSQSAGIWKGIKSPSPELLGQHINKLITENQAIVETHNPLWALRHKRQSSLSSSSSESEAGSSNGKNRRYSLSEPPTKVNKSLTGSAHGNQQMYTKDRSQSLSNEVTLVQYDNRSSYSPSLPQYSYLQVAHSSTTASASKPTISVSSLSNSNPITTSPSHVFHSPRESSPVSETICRNNNEGLNLTLARNMMKGRSAYIDYSNTSSKFQLDNPESKSSNTTVYLSKVKENSSQRDGYIQERHDGVNVTCSQCGTSLYSISNLENHLKYHCNPGKIARVNDRHTSEYSYASGSLKDNVNFNKEQELVLDLHKISDIKKDDYLNSPARVDYTYTNEVNSRKYEQPQYPYGYYPKTCAFKENNYNADYPQTNPNKKRKVSDLQPKFDKSSTSNFSTHNENNLKFVEQLNNTTNSNKHKNSNNKHHLFGGGEVRICDGNETKTIKIEPSKSKDLDMTSVPKYTCESNKIPNSAPSTLVTIARSGLNSGGTVQVESHTTSTTKTVASHNMNPLHRRDSSSSCAQATCNNFLNDHNKSSIYNESNANTNRLTALQTSFLQYAPQLQLPNLAIPGVPAPNMSALSLMYSSQIPTSSLLGGGTVKTSIPQKISLPIGTSIQAKKTDSAEFGIFDHPDKDATRLNVDYPKTLFLGKEKVPYVPGIPGPYSHADSVDGAQSNVVLQNSASKNYSENNDKNRSLINPTKLMPPTFISSSPKALPSPLATPEKIVDRSPPYSNLMKEKQSKGQIRMNPKAVINLASTSGEELNVPLVVKATEKPASLSIMQITSSEDATKTTQTNTESLPTINILSKVSSPVCEGLVKELNMPNIKIKTGTKRDSKSDDQFLVPPRKRPNTLAIKPQNFVPKPSLALIGSTLVSPDTPRPKKSCAQLLLNGSAYTYLGLKVTTRCFFCCIYRPQPMYVPQSSDPKLSMYSNWQLRKPVAENSLNLDPVQAMSLYVSKTYNDKAYTIAKPKEMDSILTHSTYWTYKVKSKFCKSENMDMNENCTLTNKENSENVDSLKIENNEMKAEKSSKSASSPTLLKDQKDDANESSSKRIKIFEGGFKTNEDYTYVRGRGRGRYVCEACGIRCKKPSMLKKHIRTHTDLRPYSCGHCVFSFKTKGNLTKHLKSKAHYKRCIEMDINPVPTTVDDSHINQQALAMQGKLEQTRDASVEPSEEEDEDDDEDEEDEDYEDDDEEEEEEQFEDAPPCFSTTSFMATESLTNRRASPIKMSSASALISISVPLMSTGMSSSFLEPARTSTSNENEEEKSGDNTFPMDLSIKRPSVLNLSGNKTSNLVKTNKNFLTARPSPLQDQNNKFCIKDSASPTTPILQHPADILSPVTESSALLNIIYDTTLRASSTTNRLKQNPIENVSFQAYLKECAVLDTTMKRHQYHHSSTSSSSSENSPMSPQSYPTLPISQSQGPKMDVKISSVDPPASSKECKEPKKLATSAASSVVCTSGLKFVTSVVNLSSENKSSNSTKSITDSFLTPKIINSNISSSHVEHKVIKIQKEGLKNAPSSQEKGHIEENVAKKTENIHSTASNIGSSTTTVTISTSNVASTNCSTTNTLSCASSSSSHMPVPPANLTVLNSLWTDSKTAFLAPSGVIPSSTNRHGSDDGKCKCTICHKEFGKQSQLSLHMNIHYMERPFRCDSCAVSFRSSGHLQKHKRSTSHYNKVNMNMTFGTPSTENPRPFKCHDCKVAFRIHGHLAKHLRSKLHIMKLECLGKLPFGTYAEIERSGANLNEIDTTDCENSLESLQLMANKLYEKDPGKFTQWQSQHGEGHRVRTISNSSTNSDDYPLQDDQDDSLTWAKNMDEDSGDDDDNDTSPSQVIAHPRKSSPLPSVPVGGGGSSTPVGGGGSATKDFGISHSFPNKSPLPQESSSSSPN